MAFSNIVCGLILRCQFIRRIYPYQSLSLILMFARVGLLCGDVSDTAFGEMVLAVDELDVDAESDDAVT